MSVKENFHTLTLEQTADALNVHINDLKLLVNANPHLQVEYKETIPVVRVSGVLAYLFAKNDEALKRAYAINRTLAMDYLRECLNDATSPEALVEALKAFKI